MRTGHLFAGAGGGIYADLILGHEPQFAVEWEQYPAAILRQRFPSVRVYETDARMFDPSKWGGRVDSLHAGFPCQDISVAGMGRGIRGDRSSLWSEVVRCADVIRPRELFLENSPAIISRGLDRVLSDLAALGFNAEWCCLPASAVGAPHRRDRWWCLARRSDAVQLGCNQDGERPGRPVRDELRHDTPQEFARDELELRSSDDGGAVLDRLQDRLEAGSAEGPVERPSDGGGGGWWQIEPNVGRLVDGLADRVNRIKALGNGQVPLQAAIAYQLLERRYAAIDAAKEEGL